jgi:hypothetical protein
VSLSDAADEQVPRSAPKPGVVIDRRRTTQRVAERLALEYETEQGRHPLLVGDPDRGSRERANVTDALSAAGHDPSLLWSFDILSLGVPHPRFIEVKGRGTSGPITGVLDREYDTACRLGEDAWLYVVFGCSTESQQLSVAPDWTRFAWQREREPRPEMIEDQDFGGLLPDRRSSSQRRLEAEGLWSLSSEIVREQFAVVAVRSRTPGPG